MEMYESKQSKRNQGIAETGKMLLSGWTMLSNVLKF